MLKVTVGFLQIEINTLKNILYTWNAKNIKTAGERMTIRPTHRYVQVATVLLPKASTHYHISDDFGALLFFLPCDHWFGSAKHLAD